MVKHGVFSNIGHCLSNTWQADKALLFWVIVGTIVRVLFPFAGIVTPRIVIDEIVAGSSAERFLGVMAIMAVVLVTIHFLNGFVNTKIDENTLFVARAGFTIEHSKKLLTMDFANRESPDFVKLNNKTTQNVFQNASADGFIRTLSGLAVNIGGLILFGGLIATAHPLILVLLALSVVVNGFLQRWHRKFDENRREVVAQTNKKVWSTRWSLGFKPFAKDLRLYSMVNWLRNRYEEYLAEVRASDVKSAKHGLVVGIVDSLMVLIRDGAAYVFLTYLLLTDQIGIGEFVMLFAAIGGMAAWINGILTNGTALFRSSVEVSDRRETLAYKDAKRVKTKNEAPTKAMEIRLENVSYTYPEATKPTLENINITIAPGERIAIVGVNGAGKTTLVKLICGFYMPTKGKVYCNNIDVTEYDRDDYFTQITAVFQSIHLLANTIEINIAQSSTPDREKVISCLKKADFWEKVKSFEHGIETKLVKEVHEDALELSGGEMQKLALARAIYKNAPLLILDEPTAALDPIAENETYQQYASLTQDKTSIYISHRLASTRFCDRIILLDGNKIAELGSHDELIQLNGKYAEMFNIQASYYKEGDENA